MSLELFSQLPVLASLVRSFEDSTIHPFLCLVSASKALYVSVPWNALTTSLEASFREQFGSELLSLSVAEPRLRFCNAHAQLRQALVCRRNPSPSASIAVGQLHCEQGGDRGSVRASLVASASTEPTARQLHFRAATLNRVVEEIQFMFTMRHFNQTLKFWPASGEAQVRDLLAAVVGLMRSWQHDEHLVLWQAASSISSEQMTATFVIDGGPAGQAIEMQLVDTLERVRGSRLP